LAEGSLDQNCPKSAAQPAGGLRPAYFYVIVVCVFLADQVSKAWIMKALALQESYEVFGKAFLLTLTHNTGGAWGMLPKGNYLFIVFASVAIFALLYAYHRMARSELLVGAAFALALGGALGNLLDRLRYGWVIDFFEARIIHWPIFNVADSAISLGIVLLVCYYFKTWRSEYLEQRQAATALSSASAPLPEGQQRDEG
jgi:signal peptidase II